MNEPSTEPAGAAEPNRAESSGAARESESPGRRGLRWVLNLLASGLVLIASLVAGREVLLWWRSPADVAGSADEHDQPPGFDFENGFVDLRFGAAPVVVRREVVSGNRDLVLETLRRNSTALADDVLARDPSPTEPADVFHAAQRGDHESRRHLMARITTMTPAARKPDHWMLYEWPAPVPANVVLTEGTSRPLAWGLAFPQESAAGEPTRWSVFSWAETDVPQAEAAGPNVGANGFGGMPPGFPVAGPPASPPAQRKVEGEPHRPEGTTLGICLMSHDAAAVATFQARGGPTWIERHYDAWNQQLGGTVEQAWHSTGPLRRARYRLPRGAVLLVQLDGRDPEQVRGMVTQWPPRDPAVRAEASVEHGDTGQ